MRKFWKYILLGFLVLLSFSFFASYYKSYAPAQVLAICADTEDGGCIPIDSGDDDDDGDEREYCQEGNCDYEDYFDWAEDYNSWLADSNKFKPGTSEYENWKNNEPKFNPRCMGATCDADDGGGDGGSGPIAYCPAPNCGGSCTGCLREVSCTESDCGNPSCSCGCSGPADDQTCSVSGSYCVEPCSGYQPSECPASCSLVGQTIGGTCLTSCATNHWCQLSF